MLKGLSVFEMFTFFSDFLVMYILYVFPNISRNNGYQSMKFFQLLEINIGNIYLEKSYIKYDGTLISETFTKNQN